MCLLSVFTYMNSNAQMYTVTGIVYDEEGLPLPGCHVHYNDVCDVTDISGRFKHLVLEGRVGFTFSFIGYTKKDTVFTVIEDTDIKVLLFSDNQLISEIDVVGNSISTTKSKKNEVINADFLKKNLTGTFIKSIERLPGVNSMDIGANASKPIIRGMSFNRVVVSQDGVKQEGQQWGADHGLEIDPFSIETAEIVKGASGIEYGSDAIGGYINISNNKLPAKKSISGEVNFLTKSVNDTYGGSLFFQGRSDKYFFKFRTTALDFGDYRVPTKSISYLSRIMKVYNNRLKNTAGKEYDLSFSVGRVSDVYKTTFSVSNVYQKAGFFPGAHGIPDDESVIHDGDYRNIEYPYQEAGHFKAQNQTKFFLNNGNVILDFGFQDNLRQEWSSFHTHYPGQPKPKRNEDLELKFHLKTYSANVKYDFKTLFGNFTIGTQSQFKDNNVGGYNFLLPEYESLSLGAFTQAEINVNDKLKVNGGIRYDYSGVSIGSFFDEILYQYLLSRPDPDINEAEEYAQRSYALDENYGDLSWMLGLVYKPNEKLITRMNLGKAFRMPTAIELGSNGIHHGSFRHEKGDVNLKSEKGFYFDGNIEWGNSNWIIEASFYMYLFSNYLYLQPTGEFSKLPHGGQIYKYSQSEALVTGNELSIQRKWLGDKIESIITLEHIYNRRLSSDKSQRYPLPFTPPVNSFIELDYKPRIKSKTLKDSRLFINTRFALKQNRVSNNEEKTDGYMIYGLGVSSQVMFTKQKIEFVLQGNNLLNTKYFNHVSFYRKVEIPEQGRNIQLLVKVPF